MHSGCGDLHHCYSMRPAQIQQHDHHLPHLPLPHLPGLRNANDGHQRRLRGSVHLQLALLEVSDMICSVIIYLAICTLFGILYHNSYDHYYE